MRKTLCGVMMVFGVAVCPAATPNADQPPLEVRVKRLITIDGQRFRDLNGNGVLDPYEDWRLPIDVRIDDLVARMTIPEKAGLMLHASVQGFTGPNGIVLDERIPIKVRGVEMPAPPPTRELVLKRNIRWLLVRATEPAEVAARAANAVQELAEGSRLGVPVVLSSDPRHSVQYGSPASKPVFSTWPEQLGFGAIGDPEVVRSFGRIANREYRAIGLRATLSPMADLATEPRWSRISGTFGEDAELAARLTSAYIEGFQGPRLGRDSVLTVTKHWPGHGPVKDGLDPHLAYGRWEVYPGGNFEYHLIPFRAAIDAGTGGIMPGYAIPVGIDSVGMAFSPRIVQDLLRRQFHYDGIVVTDWLKSMPWGVENLSQEERHRRIVEAGCDQLGGEDDPEYLIALMERGALSRERIDQSVRRILRPMFAMGLFEDPYVDVEAAGRIVNQPAFREAGQRAQSQSVVLLKNHDGILPLRQAMRVYVDGFDRDVAAQYAVLTDKPEDADAVLIKVAAPFALHRYPPGEEPQGAIAELFAKRLHEGALDYAGAENREELARIKRLVASGRPVIVFMYLDRPAILTEFIDDVAGLLVHFSSNDRALLDVAFGRVPASGHLPFDLPRDMASVLQQQPDVPHDLSHPLFRAGYGLTYRSLRAAR